MSRNTVFVIADIGCYGIEVRAADDPEGAVVVTPPEDLGLSDKLVRDFQLWQGWFDGVVGLCGMEGRFEVLGERFDEVGRQLAERVASELGQAVSVGYVAQGGWCIRLGLGYEVAVQE
jgi:hypothetical protein